jgi:hypothetical protein
LTHSSLFASYGEYLRADKPWIIIFRTLQSQRWLLGAKDVYAYLQIMIGVLVECEGVLEGNSEVYAFKEDNVIRARYRAVKELHDSPKLYIPLPAAYLKDGELVTHSHFLNNTKVQAVCLLCR